MQGIVARDLLQDQILTGKDKNACNQADDAKCVGTEIHHARLGALCRVAGLSATEPGRVCTDLAKN
jgi:hypothetical protein